jgi:hypothetical protein
LDESFLEVGMSLLAMAWQAMGAVRKTRITVMSEMKMLPGVGNLIAAAVTRKMIPKEEALVAAWMRAKESGIRRRPMEAMRKQRLPRTAKKSVIMN